MYVYVGVFVIVLAEEGNNVLDFPKQKDTHTSEKIRIPYSYWIDCSASQDLLLPAFSIQNYFVVVFTIA